MTDRLQRAHSIEGLPDGGPHSPRPAFIVQCVTFNMAAEKLTSLAAELYCLGGDGGGGAMPKVADFYAIGTQETRSCAQWQAIVVECLASKGMVLLAAEQLLAIHLLVFVKLELVPWIAAVSTTKVATGVGNVVGNKGSVAIAIHLTTGHRLLFINSHFAAHEGRVDHRKEDYERMVATLNKTVQSCSIFCRHHIHRAFRLKRNQVHDESFAISRREVERKRIHRFDSSFGRALHSEDDHQMTFWFGDLNFRVDGNRDAVEQALQEGYFEVLRNNDQLNKERQKGEIFQQYKEGFLHFPPTYKFDKGTQDYDTSMKLRIPSWPDRILWKSSSQQNSTQIHLISYHSVNKICISDHKPVIAVFLLHLSQPPSPTPINRGSDSRAFPSPSAVPASEPPAKSTVPRVGVGLCMDMMKRWRRLQI